MSMVALARRAMNTRFELVLHGAPELFLRAAGEEALDEVERIEAQLSLFRPTSEVARINRHAADTPVRVSPPVFALLERARELWIASGGAFDPTVGAGMEFWGFRKHRPPRPATPDVRSPEPKPCGMDLVVLDRSRFEVQFSRRGLQLDLGAIGKGYAVDMAIGRLREAGVDHALLHGGTSSVYGMGIGPAGVPWKIGIPAGPPGASEACGTPIEEEWAATVELADCSLGVSAAWGRSIQSGGRTVGHVLDPRSGEPAREAVLAAVVLPEAVEADALSTALLVLGVAGLPQLGLTRPGLRALVVPSLALDPGQSVVRCGL